MQLSRTFFLLPNFFTLANVFCGFLALTLCSGEATVSDLYAAAIAICFGFVFDLFDGRVARLTKTQSTLGLQLDSLADAITFGAAPALLVFKWGLSSFGKWGLFIAFLFLCGGVLRLARFNVLASRRKEDGPSKFFVGLPIPIAAAVIVSLVVVHYRVGGRHVAGQGAIAALVVVLAYLMISRVRFRTFKQLRLTKRSISVAFVLLLACVVITARLRASFMFMFVISCYLALGLTEEVYRFASERRRKRREKKIAAGQPLEKEDEDEVDDEAEVLRELGADDDDGDEIVPNQEIK